MFLLWEDDIAIMLVFELVVTIESLALFQGDLNDKLWKSTLLFCTSGI